MYTRFSKIAFVWAIALYALLVVLNNLTDYGSNYQFVAQVLKMDTTFPGNRGMWRAIDAPFAHHLFYWVIIVSEVAVTALCSWGGLRLFKAREEAERFHQAKGPALAGLTLGIVLWFTGFITIGGEWFLMWQSEMWNGQQAAFRLVVILGVALIYLARPESEKDA